MESKLTEAEYTPRGRRKLNDNYTMIVALVSVVTLMAGFAIGVYTERWTAPLFFFAITILGVLSIGFRMWGSTKDTKQAHPEE